MPHILAHLPHSIHFSSSITGSPKPSCEIAPTGQKGIIGQRWFCGQRCGFTLSAIYCVLNFPFA